VRARVPARVTLPACWGASFPDCSGCSVPTHILQPTARTPFQSRCATRGEQCESCPARTAVRRAARSMASFCAPRHPDCRSKPARIPRVAGASTVISRTVGKDPAAIATSNFAPPPSSMTSVRASDGTARDDGSPTSVPPGAPAFQGGQVSCACRPAKRASNQSGSSAAEGGTASLCPTSGSS
jgi:hypothetical protein